MFSRAPVLPARCAALATVAALIAACGGSRVAHGTGAAEPSHRPTSATASGPHRVAARLLFFSADLRIPYPVRTVLRTERDRSRLPGWFAGPSVDPAAARTIAQRIGTTDLTRNAVVVHAESIGCRPADGARLLADGNRLTVRLLGRPAPPPECYVPYEAVSVFEVARGALPADPVFGPNGVRPDPAGPGRLAAFAPVPAGSAAGAAKTEVTRAGALDDFLATLPEKAAERLRTQLARRAEPSAAEGPQRLFAFNLTGCRATGADLVVSRGGLRAVATGGEGARCIRAERFAAVFSLPEPLVPRQP